MPSWLETKENWYFFSTLYLPWDVSNNIFNKRYCNTNFAHFYNSQGTFLHYLTFLELIDSHIIGIYWRNKNQCVYVKVRLWMMHFNFFFTWNLSKLVSRKVTFKSQNYFIVYFIWKKRLEGSWEHSGLCPVKSLCTIRTSMFSTGP